MIRSENTFLRRGSLFPGLTDENLKLLLTVSWQELIMNNIGGVFQPKITPYEFEPILDKISCVPKLNSRFVIETMGTAQPVFFNGKEKIIFCLPVFVGTPPFSQREVWKNTDEWIASTISDPFLFLGQQKILRSLRGFLFFAFDPSFFSNSLRWSQLQNQVLSQGAEMAVLQEFEPKKNSVVSATPGFLSGGLFAPSLFASWKASSLAMKTSIDSRTTTDSLPTRVFVGRRVLSEGDQGFFMTLLFFGIIIWGIGGILIVLLLKRKKDILKFTLGRQLFGGFALAIFPAIILASSLLAQEQIFRKSRIETEWQKRLSENLNRQNEGSEIAKAWLHQLFVAGSNIFSNLLYTSSIKASGSRQLSSNTAESAFKSSEMSLFAGAGALQQKAKNSDSFSQKQKVVCQEIIGHTILENFFMWLRERGFQPGEISVVFPEGGNYFFPGENKTRDVINKVQSQTCCECFRALGLRERGKTSGGEVQKMVLGSQIEDFQAFLRLLMGEESLAAMIHSSCHQMEWAVGQSPPTGYFRRILWNNQQPFSELHVTFSINQLDRLNFLGWHDLEAGKSEIALGASILRSPSMGLVPPYFRALKAPLKSGVEYNLAIHRPGNHDVTALVGSKMTKVVRRIGEGENARLVMAIPSTSRSFIIRGEVPIGQILKTLLDEINLQRLVLLVFILLTMLLARLISNGFLKPVLEFVNAAKRVARGDFEFSLPEIYSNEFGTLARAFNRMATEAREGRLLGKFVSGKVREVARNKTRESQALEGESITAVVMFVYVSGFRDLLQKEDPVNLLQDMNFSLQSISREILRADGEIDKLIGDKVLAYFTADENEFAKPVQYAIRAARQIQTVLAPLLDRKNLRLGIGITAGPVLSGILGVAELRLEMTILGDTVNLGNRSLTHAKNGRSKFLS
ncbi:MAG: HAMP domain-containing protein [Candidatus Riflebacteria bacterium]|nr:HAMP domain-containing protein [Candidatus Riflebacteria bacterium]